MTMHLAHPALTLLGKKKSKKKYRTSEQARNARANQQDWERLQEKWNKMSRTAINTKNVQTRSEYKLSVPIGRDTKHIPSADTWTTGAVATPQAKKYTGDNMIGIGTLHKSNAVPIFSDNEAKEISRMRRG